MKQENTHIRGFKGQKLVVFIKSKYACCTEACDLRDNFNRFQANNMHFLV
jgi:peroxiredoxin Q/BCP